MSTERSFIVNGVAALGIIVTESIFWAACQAWLFKDGQAVSVFILLQQAISGEK
jgi:hypothetical protein